MKKLLALLTLAVMLFAVGCAKAPAEPVNIAALKGPTGMGISYLMDQTDKYNVELQDAPDVVVVSLGVDTFENDPISQFKLKSADYPKIGARIAALGVPTVFVMEGGYAVDEIGINAVGVLQGFETR